MKFGINELDRLIKIENKLITIASRPGMGKSSLVIKIARNVSTNNNVPIAIFSLDMSKEQMANRLLSDKKLLDNHWTSISGEIKDLKDSTFYIDDTPGISVNKIIEKCKKLKCEKNIGLIIIDYLQLVGYNKNELLSRDKEITNIMAKFKRLINEINIPIIITSQLSREPEKRENHRPVLSDFRKSSSIAQISDVVMFLYNDSHYNQNKKKGNAIEIIIAKNNDGHCETVEVEEIV